MQKGIIFDLDGVICHTDQYHYQAWKCLADDLGIYFDEEINKRLKGVSRMDSLEIILEKSDIQYSSRQKSEMAERKNEIYKNLLQKMTTVDLSDEVKTTLMELRNRNVLLAIGSSSKNAPLILERIGLGDFFDAVSDGNNISHSKPDPEVFLKAAEMLGLPAEECIVVEDAAAGVLAAHRGGMKAAALGELIHHTDAEYKIGGFSDLLNIVDEGKSPDNYNEILKKLRDHVNVEKTPHFEKYIREYMGEIKGYFDPLVSNERNKPEKKYSIKNLYFYEGFQVGEMRQCDGWNNFDITNGAVITEKKIIDSNHGKICFEQYHSSQNENEKSACLLYFHGGGFVSGSIDVVRNICKAIAYFGNISVINVDYSLAPEKKYPTAIEEGMDVLRYIQKNAGKMKIDAARIGVAGDSAGGNIAGAIAVRDSQMEQPAISCQVLIYPLVVMDEELEKAMCPWNRELYHIAADDEQILQAMKYIKDNRKDIARMYLGEASGKMRDVSFINNDLMFQLPRTLIVTAEYDYLRIQDEAYCDLLGSNGVETTEVCYEGMDHAFLDKIGFYPQAEDCVRIIADFLCR